MMHTVRYRHPHRTVSTWVSDGADVSIGRWRLTAMVTTTPIKHITAPTKYTATPTTHIATPITHDTAPTTHITASTTHTTAPTTHTAAPTTHTAAPTTQTTTTTTHTTTPTTIGGSYQLVRGRASFVTSARIIRHERTYLMIRADDDNHGVSKRMVYNGYRTPPHEGDGVRGNREAAKRKRRALPAIRVTTSPHATPATRHKKNIRNARGNGIADSGVGNNGYHMAPVLYDKVSLSGRSAPGHHCPCRP